MSNKAILCVDDEKMILDCLRMQLKHAFGNDYIYEFAQNVEKAMALINLFNDEGIILEVIISDWLMPGIKGDDFLIEIHRSNPDTLKIILSGQIDSYSIERIKKNGSLYKHISKPWTYEELIGTIKEGLSDKV
ncbi:MAG: response regulator [Spirochaetes bacterium]|nr:response regulator [Spirochaetota bacterium]